MTLFRCFFTVAFLLLGQVMGAALPGVAAEPGAMEASLRTMIAAEGANQQFICRGRTICTASIIPLFYERRGFQPCWSRDGRLNAESRELIGALVRADAEGLRPADYHLYSITYLLSKYERLEAEGRLLTQAELVDLELLLTDAFFLYGSHLLKGRINPETIDEQWFPGDAGLDLAAVLEEGLAAHDVTGALQRLRPPHAGYQKMVEALAALRAIAARGGWPVVGDGGNLSQGMRHRRVYALRQRLMVSGDYEAWQVTSDNLFDDQLALAVRRFQARHGLAVDGVVGRETLAALNVPVESRLRQIIANLERWRWIPHDLGRRYIFVNIADFTLQIIENGQTVLASRVVVGQRQRSTPAFSGIVEYLVLNPYWYLPETIIVEDVAPEMRKNPAYLQQKKIRVFAAGSQEGQELDPATIDWSRLSKENLPYTLRQEPGAWNALGRVKIMFPNKFSIYLHDTPSLELFDKNARDFSSGCIRVENPQEIVAYLLKTSPLWSREAIQASLATGRQQVVFLPEQVPIHILYWTAWGDDKGGIQFRNDIYGRDKVLVTALDGLNPSS